MAETTAVVKEDRYNGHTMRDKKRIDRMLSVIWTVWKQHPDLRLGQLLMNAKVVLDEERGGSREIFYVEDDEMERAIKDFAQKFPEGGSTWRSGQDD